MSELPRIEDLPRADEGYDMARVEQAFEAFTERLRSLEQKLDALAPALRAPEVRPAYEPDDEDWPVDATYERAPLAPSPEWIAAVPPPLPRALVLPRIALEAGFLLAVALLAGLADLAALWIVVVMAVGWAIVALSEWSAAARRARWRLEQVAPALDGPETDELDDPWALPPVEATVVVLPDESEQRTVVTKLPEPVVEPEAKPRRRFLRRG